MTQDSKKHTPGPWKAHEITSMDWWVILADKPLAKDVVHETIAQVDKGLNNGDPNPNAQANAELIASAPDLLKENEALKEERDALKAELSGLIKHLRQDPHHHGYDLSNARKLIEK